MEGMDPKSNGYGSKRGFSTPRGRFSWIAQGYTEQTSKYRNQDEVEWPDQQHTGFKLQIKSEFKQVKYVKQQQQKPEFKIKLRCRMQALP